jgi:hypothetical protein
MPEGLVLGAPKLNISMGLCTSQDKALGITDWHSQDGILSETDVHAAGQHSLGPRHS